MNKWVTLFRVVVLAAISLIFAGCGGGGSTTSTSWTNSTDSTASASIVKGVAATGSAMAYGTVYLRDSSRPCRELTAPIDAYGNFQFDVTGLTKPFFLKAVGTSEGQQYTLFAIAVNTGMTNINPMSHMATLAAAQGLDLNTYFSNFTPTDFQKIAASFPNAVLDIRKKLLPLTVCNGLANVNPVTDTFVANHKGLDGLFDLVKFEITSNHVNIWNKNNQPIYLSQDGDILNGTINSNNIPTSTIGNPVCASLISIATGATDGGVTPSELFDYAKIFGSGS